VKRGGVEKVGGGERCEVAGVRVLEVSGERERKGVDQPGRGGDELVE